MNDPSAAVPPEVPSAAQVASWERLGVLPTEKVPLWAAYWIAGGHDGEALKYLAGLHGDDPAEVHDALPEALRDCGVEMADPAAGAAAVAFTDLARLEVSGLQVELSPGERLQYDRAVLAGRDISAPVEVTYFFGLGSPGDYPVATEEALSAMGITRVTVDEEISGDGWWFVAAFAMLQLTPEAIVGAKRLMMRLAVATGIRYDGWHVTLTGGEEQQLASRRPDLAHVTDDCRHLEE
jgi:Regulator of ribonuclease activity B